MTRKKTKSLIIILFVAIAIIAIGLIAGLSRLESTIDTKQVSWTNYSIGGLDDSGDVKDTTASIYTRSFHNADGLEIKVDEDASITYVVYFYDENDEYLNKSDVLNSDYDTAPEGAETFRIVITPTDDAEVSITEIYKYAKQLTVTVNK